MADSKRGVWLVRSFWTVVAVDALALLALLALLVQVGAGSPSSFDRFLQLLLLGVLGILGAIVLAIALIRHRVAYGIGLVLLAAPPLLLGAHVLVDMARTPSNASLDAGHGYFSTAADRTLADAIVAGDAAKVAVLAPAANTNAIGWNNMTFLRLALEDGHANPAVVAALLRAGADPDQDNQVLLGYLTESPGYGAMIAEKNERLLRAAIEAGIDLNQRNPEGFPRFFSTIQWPEGLALMLDHGARPDAVGKDGDTAIMWAVKLRYWPAIDVLLAHGARTDAVGNDGQSLRDIVRETIERQTRNQDAIPPQLLALEARLK